jgi:hypothetical protein
VRRGKKKAVVAVGRSILVIVWYLLHDEGAQFHDLGVDHYNSRINPDRKKRNHIREPGDVDVLVIGGPPGRDLRRANARMENALDIPCRSPQSPPPSGPPPQARSYARFKPSP